MRKKKPPFQDPGRSTLVGQSRSTRLMHLLEVPCSTTHRPSIFTKGESIMGIGEDWRQIFGSRRWLKKGYDFIY